LEKTMKKTTIAALGLALTLGVAGAASAQSTEPRPPRDRAGQVERGGRRGGPDQMLLKGITLTEQQKEKIQALRESERTSGSRDQFRKAMTEAREARERGDTVTANARMQELRKQMDAQRDQRIASLRGVLTSEQQRQFDANVAEWKQRADQHRGEERRGGPRRG